MPDTAVEIRSAWVPVQGPGDLLLLDILESTSREAAHAALLRMLSDFQSPLVTRIESETAGDVMFAFPGDTVRIFARGNLVVVVRSAARPVRPVSVPASQLDAELVRKPMSAASFRRQILRPASAAPLAPGATVRLDMNIDPSETRAMTYKFFAASGEVSLQDGGPVYRATKEGPQELTVVALDDRGETVRQDLALE